MQKPTYMPHRLRDNRNATDHFFNGDFQNSLFYALHRGHYVKAAKITGSGKEKGNKTQHTQPSSPVDPWVLKEQRAKSKLAIWGVPMKNTTNAVTSTKTEPNGMDKVYPRFACAASLAPTYSELQLPPSHYDRTPPSLSGSALFVQHPSGDMLKTSAISPPIP